MIHDDKLGRSVGIFWRLIVVIHGDKLGRSVDNSRWVKYRRLGIN